MAEKSPATDKKPTFETALQQLEALLEEMENGDIALEEMLQRYEEGTQLVRLCTEKLAAAEKRIEIVTRNAAGKPETAPFNPAVPPVSAPTADTPSTAPTGRPRASRAAREKPPQDDDVSLF